MKQDTRATNNSKTISTAVWVARPKISADMFWYILMPMQPDASRLQVPVLPGDAASFHCSLPRLMPLSAIDPSLAIGFFCADTSEWQSAAQTLASSYRTTDTAVSVVLLHRPFQHVCLLTWHVFEVSAQGQVCTRASWSPGLCCLFPSCLPCHGFLLRFELTPAGDDWL